MISTRLVVGQHTLDETLSETDRIEIGVDKNTTVVFPAPLMSTIGELGTFLVRETESAAGMTQKPADPQSDPPFAGAHNGAPTS